MAMDEPVVATEKGEAALQLLSDADPARFLSPSADLAAAAREASQHIYSSLVPFSPAQPPPLPALLTGPAFDAEQIWSQIDLLARPIVPLLRRQLRRLEQQPPSAAPRVDAPADAEEERSEEGEQGSESDEVKEEESEELEGTDDEDEMAEEDEMSDEDEEDLDGEGGNGVEDKFLKTKHLEEFLEQAEEEEYGGGSAKRGEKKKKATKNWMEEDSDDDEGMHDDDEDEEEDEDEDEDELNVRNLCLCGHPVFLQ